MKHSQRESVEEPRSIFFTFFNSISLNANLYSSYCILEITLYNNTVSTPKVERIWLLVAI